MTAANDRRRPDRQQFVLRLLRRLALFLLLASATLAVMPRLLMEFGVVGPSPAEVVEEAERAVAAARSYGATPDLPEFQAAERELAGAREMVRTGEGRAARQAAQRAREMAIEAQKLALVRRTDTQRRAEAIYNDLDRQINDLEKLYSSVTPGLDKERTAQLLTVMKVTRQSTGLIFLAYEQQDYGRVVEGEARAREAVSAARDKLKSQRP